MPVYDNVNNTVITEPLVEVAKIAKNYRTNEDKIVALFYDGAEFTIDGENYISQGAFKPNLVSSGGEPKTDVFVYAIHATTGVVRHLTISYKMSNADFIANKMSREQAEIIFGADYLALIKTAADQLDIGNRVFRDAKKETYLLGYRVDVMNKKGAGYYKLELPTETLLRIYSGIGLDEKYIHAKVNGIVVPNSGIADYILTGDNYATAADAAAHMELLTEYVKTHNFVYIAFKGLNFQEKKYPLPRIEWDGDRPLAFTVEWSLDDNGKLVSNGINTSKIYQLKGNAAGNAFKELYIQHITA